MAQEDYVAIKSEALSQAAGEERYVIVNRWSREVVDNCNGHGYKSANAAHKSFAFKQRRQAGYQQGGQRSGGYQQGGQRQGYQQGNRNAGGYRASYRRAGEPTAAASPFVQEASAPVGVHAYRSTPDGRGRATNHYSTPRRRPQDVSQENTPPPPDLFDFENR